MTRYGLQLTSITFENNEILKYTYERQQIKKDQLPDGESMHQAH